MNVIFIPISELIIGDVIVISFLGLLLLRQHRIDNRLGVQQKEDAEI